MISPKFNTVSCSQCGSTFGPGDSGFSHCEDHGGAAMTDQTGKHTPSPWTLATALEECANRFRKCLIASGTSDEYANIAVADYRALIVRARLGDAP